MGLKTRKRLQLTSGKVRVKREVQDSFGNNGAKSAVLSLFGNPWDNLIILKTFPQKLDSDTEEVLEAHFLPEAASLFWDFDQKQITLIEMKGKVEMEQNLVIDWGFDKVVTMTPVFYSKYESRIVDTNFLKKEKNQKLENSLIDIVNSKIDEKIAVRMRQKLDSL